MNVAVNRAGRGALGLSELYCDGPVNALVRTSEYQSILEVYVISIHEYNFCRPISEAD